MPASATELLCLFGEINTTSGFCDCFPDFSNDFLLFRYSNCGFSLLGFRVLGGLTLLMLTLATISNLFTVRKTLSGSLLRYLSVSTFLMVFCFLVLMIEILITATFSYFSYFLYVAGVVLCSYSFSFLFLSILLPMSRLQDQNQMKKFQPWKRFWLMVMPLCLLACLLTSFVGASLSVSNNDIFNNWLISQAVVFLVAGLVALPSFYIFASALQQALLETAKIGKVVQDNDQRNSNLRSSDASSAGGGGVADSLKQSFVQDMLEKVVRIKRVILWSALGLEIFCVYCLVFDLVLNSVPLFWLLLLFALIGISLYGLNVAKYVSKRRTRERTGTLTASLSPVFLAEFGKKVSKRLSGIMRKESKEHLSPELLNAKKDMVLMTTLLPRPENVPSTIKEESKLASHALPV